MESVRSFNRCISARFCKRLLVVQSTAESRWIIALPGATRCTRYSSLTNTGPQYRWVAAAGSHSTAVPHRARAPCTSPEENKAIASTFPSPFLMHPGPEEGIYDPSYTPLAGMFPVIQRRQRRADHFRRRPGVLVPLDYGFDASVGGLVEIQPILNERSRQTSLLRPLPVRGPRPALPGR